MVFECVCGRLDVRPRHRLFLPNYLSCCTSLEEETSQLFVFKYHSRNIIWYRTMEDQRRCWISCRRSFSRSPPRLVFFSFLSFWIYPHFQSLNVADVLHRAGTASVLISYTIGLLVDMFFVTRVWLCMRLLLFFRGKHEADDPPFGFGLKTSD